MPVEAMSIKTWQFWHFSIKINVTTIPGIPNRYGANTMWPSYTELLERRRRM
jgi:hypothetical protein